MTILETANKPLITQLKDAVSSLVYASERDYPLQPIMLPAPATGNIEHFLQTIALLQTQSWEQFLGQASVVAGATPLMMRSYQTLKQTLQTHLVNVQVCCVGQRHPSDEGWEDRGTLLFPLLLGQTLAGDWVGLCPKFKADATASDHRIRPTSDRTLYTGGNPINIQTLKIMAQLKTATVGSGLLLQDYDSCEWVAECFWQAAATRDALLVDLLSPTGFLKIFPFQGFSNCLTDGYRAEQLTVEEKSSYQKFASLDHCLRSQLTDLQEYIIGGYTNFHLYVIGKTSAGNWAGVSTQAVWT